MVTVKTENGKLTIDFSSTMWFHETILCPSEHRKELHELIEKKDNEKLFRFCVKHFGEKIFYFEGGK